MMRFTSEAGLEAAREGLEFRIVAILAGDEDAIPDADRLATAADAAAMEEAQDRERHLLCMALTRARDEVVVSCVAPGSEILDDLSTLVLLL